MSNAGGLTIAPEMDANGPASHGFVDWAVLFKYFPLTFVEVDEPVNLVCLVHTSALLLLHPRHHVMAHTTTGAHLSLEPVKHLFSKHQLVWGQCANSQPADENVLDAANFR